MLQSLHYTIGAIKEDVRHLVECGSLDRNQHLHTLCRFYPDREWCQIERELEFNQFLLRDRICDLVSQECWARD